MAERAPDRESLALTGPAGRLEALLEMPRDPVRPAVAVICHPHPRHHGTMHNKVVHTLARAMNDLRIPAVRFNFRGVGESDGEYADGHGEIDDALAVARWARERYPGSELWLCGFSFGGMIAAGAALTASPGQLVTVAPAATRMAGLLEGRQPDCAWLIVQGDADDVVNCDDVVAWVNSLAPGPELVILPDVGHFFHGRLTLLRQTLISRLGANERTK